MTVGTVGLIWFKLKSDDVPAGRTAPAMDYMFLVMLCLTSLSGLFTLGLSCRCGNGHHPGDSSRVRSRTLYHRSVWKICSCGLPFSGAGKISNRIGQTFPNMTAH